MINNNKKFEFPMGLEPTIESLENSCIIHYATETVTQLSYWANVNFYFLEIENSTAVTLLIDNCYLS